MTAFEDCAYKPGPGQAFKTSAKVNSLDFIWSTTAEYEVPEFNLGNTFNHSDMAELMTPRPFMVERGHEDGVSYDSWVSYEYAKVREHYDELNLEDQTHMAVFNGPHTIYGVGTYEFLHHHLDWGRGFQR